MIRRILTLTAAAALLIGLLLPAVSLAGTEMYVYTANGKGLNCRTEPYVGDNIIKSIPYGTKVYVEYHLGNGWSCIRWSGAYSVAYVQSRFLVSYQPSTGPVTTIPSGTVTDNASTVAELNVIFKTYRRVANPYYVTARPVRASGWVNLRFAPTKQAEVISTHRDNDRLIVIAELAGWYQVEDPDTGAVGYMVSQYVSR